MVKFHRLDPPARLEELRGQQVAIGGDVEHRQGLPACKPGRERMLAGLQRLAGRPDVLQSPPVVRKAHGIVRRGARRVCEHVAFGPFHGSVGHAQVLVVHPPRRSGHVLPSRREPAIHGAAEGDPRVRRPDAGSPGRATVEDAVLRVDGHIRPGALGDGRGRQPERPRPHHGDILRATGERCPHNRHTGAPRERPTAAAVAVVMNHQLVADGLGVHPRSCGAERTQAHRDPRQPPNVRTDRRELRRLTEPRPRPPGGRTAP